MMALYVASHYKNSPNDLQLMSDAPGHRLFVLLAPLKGNEGGLPEPLCVIQVALEGNISRGAVLNSLSRGTREAGDLIPWLVAQQFQDADFASLSGARVVRIAVHPDYARMGYGARALQALEAFYSENSSMSTMFVTILTTARPSQPYVTRRSPRTPTSCKATRSRSEMQHACQPCFKDFRNVSRTARLVGCFLRPDTTALQVLEEVGLHTALGTTDRQ